MCKLMINLRKRIIKQCLDKFRMVNKGINSVPVRSHFLPMCMPVKSID